MHKNVTVNSLPFLEGTALHPREKRRTKVRNAFGECPGHRDSSFFCKDDGVGPSGSGGPSGDDGSPGSSKNYLQETTRLTD